jgi:hypothetical protein
VTSHDVKSLKLKTRKGNQVMKNRNIQFKPTAGVLIPLLLACFAAVFVSAAAPAIAGDTVPFKGTLSGTIISSVPLDECHVLTEIVNGGNATQLGRYNGTAESIFNLCDLTYVGSYVFIAANGDSISGPFTGTLTPTSIAGVFDNDELAFITGGTGRFARAGSSTTRFTRWRRAGIGSNGSIGRRFRHAIPLGTRRGIPTAISTRRQGGSKAAACWA